MPTEDRWPPVYSAEELAREIRTVAGRPDIREHFFEPISDRSGPLCQGDILAFASGVPVIGPDGRLVEQDLFDHWLTIGNTCDVARADIAWTQIVPVRELFGATQSDIADLRGYQTCRRFYVPSWREPERVFAADFLTPVALEKTAVGGAVTVVARLSRAAWVLLHSCLVRFLARDDGRYD